MKLQADNLTSKNEYNSALMVISFILAIFISTFSHYLLLLDINSRLSRIRIGAVIVILHAIAISKLYIVMGS